LPHAKEEIMPPKIAESEVAANWDRNAEVWADQVRARWDIARTSTAVV